MPVDPQLQPILDASAAMMALDADSLGPGVLRQIAEQSILPFPPPDVADVSDHDVPGPAGPVPVRLHRPALDKSLPVILFLHGGGWVMGTLDQYERMSRQLALHSGCAVLSVDYRLAPEHPYPAALEDCQAALQWLGDNAGRLGIDGARIAVAGDSAGGNLSAALALLSRDRAVPVRHQLLLYPVTDRGCDTASYRENDRYLLTPAMMRWYWKQYVGDRGPVETPHAAPAEFADLSGLAPATVITAEFDPLRDEGEDYALRLARAGVPVQLVRAPGMIHGFMAMTGLVDAADTWLAWAGKRVSDALRDEA